MKNHIICLSFILAAFISYSQIGFGVGYESSGKSEYNTAIKFNIESLKINNITYNGFIIGLDFGINFLENDRTGEAGLVNNPQESTRFLYTILTPGFKLGYQFSNKLYITGAAGLNLVQEHQEFNSSSTGIYSVESDYTNSSLYFRAGINYVSGGAVINPGLGYGSNGFYVSNTFYSGSTKIKDGIKNRKFNREKYHVGYKKEFSTDVTIQQLNKENKPVYGVRLHGAFPTSVGGLGLDNSSDSSIQELTVQWSYDRWVPENALTSTLGGGLRAIRNLIS